MSSTAEYRTILCVDVEGFADPARTLSHQAVVRDGMYRALRRDCHEADVPWESIYHDDRGDGVLMLVRPQAPKKLPAAELPREVVACWTGRR